LEEGYKENRGYTEEDERIKGKNKIIKEMK
jgi:hypothetical protein